MWGALFAKYDLFYKIKNTIKLKGLWTNVLMLFILACSFFLRAIILIHAASVLFMIVFACCFYMMEKSRNIENFFMLVGKHSTNIWLVHTFFCYYYFHDFIYGLKYPILIYIVTFGFSFISSVVINKIYRLLFGKMDSYILQLKK